MTDTSRLIADNLAQVRARIDAAARRSGRTAESVRLVAVTKYVRTEMAAALVAAGALDLAESRPQELWAKADTLADPAIRWHLIGHLQRNKIRRTLPLVALLHSVDSRRLLTALEAEAAALDRTVDVLVEVNISSDITKTGLPADELDTILAHAATLTHVNVRGLMGMASLSADPDVARRDFARLRDLRDRALIRSGNRFQLDELSMGMSGDFEVAIEEGATIVRVGSALFEGPSCD